MIQKYKVVVFTQSKLDLSGIVRYWKKTLQTSPKPFLDDYEAALINLSEFPFSHHQPQDEHLKAKGYRICPVRNYYLFYIVEGDTVQIHRILYNKMDFTKLF